MSGQSHTLDELESFQCLERLLSREPGKRYLDEWEKLLDKRTQLKHSVDVDSYLLFQIKDLLLGIHSQFIWQVRPKKASHRIPHNRHPAIEGLINVDGQLKVLVDLSALLGIDLESRPQSETDSQSFLLVIDDGHSHLCVHTETIMGIQHLPKAEMENLPSTLSKSTLNHLLYVTHWKKREQVGILDVNKIFSSVAVMLS